VSKRGVCCVVDSFCKAAANFSMAGPVTTCFRCGDDVCTNCSSRRLYSRFGKKRLCNDCQCDIDGDNRKVLARMRAQAAL
jgi:hypothetical protein